MPSKRSLSRRDFLKLAGLVPLTMTVPPFLLSLDATPIRTSAGLATGIDQNVIFIVFDAFSASNISLYGYLRDTTPNLKRLAERAVVYHNHYASGNFTTPGTASLLTGTLPWTHRAINLNETASDEFSTRTIFNAFHDRHTFAYSHNPAVNTLLTQFARGISNYVPPERLFITNDNFIQAIFGGDEDAASVAWAREIKKKEFGYAYSLFLSHLYEPLQEKKIEKYLSEFPRGLPYVDLDSYFRLEDAIDWLEERIRTGPKPFFGYFHMIPPHYPYSPPKEFVGRFGEDGFKPVEKPDDIFQQNRGGNNLLEKRTEYDEFILYVDREFGRLYDYLEKTGVLENTWVILTSDHGEMFERRISGHRTSVLYQPVIHVPLLIFEPGRASRLDVTTPTSAIDVLPTLMHITGHEIPEWAEGKILPPYAPIETGRNIYALQAWYNGKYAPITYATATLIKDQYKLIYYFGYNQLRKLGKEEFVQLFDLQADPEELSDLSAAQPGLTSDLLAELKTKLDEVNKPYIQK